MSPKTFVVVGVLLFSLLSALGYLVYLDEKNREPSVTHKESK